MVTRLTADLKILAHKRLIPTSGQGPAILSLNQEVKRLPPEDMMPGESPVSESQRNEGVEQYIQSVNKQTRTPTEAFDSRYGERLPKRTSDIVMAAETGSIDDLNFKMPEDGKTACHIWKG